MASTTKVGTGGTAASRSVAVHEEHGPRQWRRSADARPLDHAEAMANEIPGARLIVVEGMAHVLSPTSRYWNAFVDALIAHTAN